MVVVVLVPNESERQKAGKKEAEKSFTSTRGTSFNYTHTHTEMIRFHNFFFCCLKLSAKVLQCSVVLV